MSMGKTMNKRIGMDRKLTAEEMAWFRELYLKRVAVPVDDNPYDRPPKRTTDEPPTKYEIEVVERVNGISGA